MAGPARSPASLTLSIRAKTGCRAWTPQCFARNAVAPAARPRAHSGASAEQARKRTRPLFGPVQPREALGRRPRRQAREARSVGPIAWTRRTLADGLEASSRRRVVPTGCRRISHRWRPGGSHLGSWAWQRNCFPRGTVRLRSPAVGELDGATVDQRGAATDPDGGVGLNAEAFGDGSGAGTSASSRMSCSAVRHHHRTVITTASAGRRGKAERADRGVATPTSRPPLSAMSERLRLAD